MGTYVEVDVTYEVEEEIARLVERGEMIEPGAGDDWGAQLDRLVQDYLAGYIDRMEADRGK